MKEVNKLDTNYNTVLIIGNGFDLNLGLSTSYNNFMESEYFQTLLSDGSSLAKYLVQVRNLKNWIDIENQLKQYSTSYGVPDNFHKEFKSLSSSLKEYLLYYVDYSNINAYSNAFKLIKALEKRKLLLLNFNYTDSIHKVTKNYVTDSFHHIQIHGNTLEDNIIFGVEDSADIHPSHIFLKKSVNDNFNTIDFSHTLLNTNNIIFFGHALGETDHSYFDDFFRRTVLSYEDIIKKRNLIIFHYGEDDKNNFYAQLDKLTYSKIGTLKKLNNFVTLDSSKSHCIEELQNLLKPVEDNRYMKVM